MGELSKIGSSNLGNETVNNSQNDHNHQEVKA